MIFLAVHEKQSMQNFRIKFTRNRIHISYFGWMDKALIGSFSVKPVSVPKIENNYYSHYDHNSKNKVQTAVRNSWSDFGKKTSSSQHGFQHLAEPLSEKEKK